MSSSLFSRSALFGGNCSKAPDRLVYSGQETSCIESINLIKSEKQDTIFATIMVGTNPMEMTLKSLSDFENFIKKIHELEGPNIQVMYIVDENKVVKKDLVEVLINTQIYKDFREKALKDDPSNKKHI